MLGISLYLEKVITVLQLLLQKRKLYKFWHPDGAAWKLIAYVILLSLICCRFFIDLCFFLMEYMDSNLKSLLEETSFIIIFNDNNSDFKLPFSKKLYINIYIWFYYKFYLLGEIMELIMWVFFFFCF